MQQANLTASFVQNSTKCSSFAFPSANNEASQNVLDGIPSDPFNPNEAELDMAMEKICQRAQNILALSELFRERLLMCIGMNMFKNNSQNQQKQNLNNSSFAATEVLSVCSASRQPKQKNNYVYSSEESC